MPRVTEAILAKMDASSIRNIENVLKGAYYAIVINKLKNTTFQMVISGQTRLFKINPYNPAEFYRL